jgi:hypothetical protein
VPSNTPISDTDGDNVPDELDACPSMPAPFPTGCPPTETLLPSPVSPTSGATPM